MVSDDSGGEAQEWRDALRHRGIVQGGGERGPRIERPRSDDAGGALLPNPWEGANRRERGAVHVERVLDRGERPLAVAGHPHIDEAVQRHVVGEADEDRIRADLSAIGHVAVLNLQEYLPKDRAFRDHALQHLMVNQGPHGLLESPELAIEAGRLELAAHGADLTDVDPADPQILREEPLQEFEIQVERLLRLPVEARDEVEAWEKARHPVLAPFAANGIDHPDRFEASVRIDVEVVRLGDAGIRRLEAERQTGAGSRVGHQVPHRRHRLVRMRDHHRGIAVVRVQDLQARRGGPNPLEEFVDCGYVDLRGGGRSQADRLIAEEVRLPAEAKVHRAELGESPDLSQDAGHRPELRLAVHRLDAERAAFVEIPHAALRGVELDGQRIREVGMAPDHVRAEQRPAVPLLHRAIAVRPLPGRQVVADRGVDVTQRDPVERLDERLIVIAESRKRSAEHPRTFEGTRVMKDFPLADWQAAKVLARNNRAGDQDEKVAAQRMTRADLVNGHVLRRMAGVVDRARDVAWIRRDVRWHAEVRRLVDVAIEDHDLHGPESMPRRR